MYLFKIKPRHLNAASGTYSAIDPPNNLFIHFSKILINIATETVSRSVISNKIDPGLMKIVKKPCKMHRNSMQI